MFVCIILYDYLVRKCLPLGSLLCYFFVLSLSHMMSFARCGTLLYQFPICAYLFSLIVKYSVKCSSATWYVPSSMYGALVYQFKIIDETPNFRDQFKNVIKCY